jgi:hypothetical protein
MSNLFKTSEDWLTFKVGFFILVGSFIISQIAFITALSKLIPPAVFFLSIDLAIYSILIGFLVMSISLIATTRVRNNYIQED